MPPCMYSLSAREKFTDLTSWRAGYRFRLRDASGIAWRLALTCRPSFAGNHEEIFNGWFLERKQQLDQSLASTVVNGNLTTARNSLKIFVRDWLLWLMQLVPSWRHQLELGPRAGGLVRYKYTKGMAFLPDMGGGRCLPQVYCCPVYRSPEDNLEPVRFTDDILLNGSRTNALLRLLVVVDDVKQAEQAWQDIKDLDLEKSSNGEIGRRSAFFLIQSPCIDHKESTTSSDIPRESVYRIATADEFAASNLCKDRPYPIGYDMLRMKKEFQGKKYILMRPDRIVYSACDSSTELLAACRRISTTLLGSPTQTEAGSVTL